MVFRSLIASMIALAGVLAGAATADAVEPARTYAVSGDCDGRPATWKARRIVRPAVT